MLPSPEKQGRNEHEKIETPDRENFRKAYGKFAQTKIENIFIVSE